MATVTRVRGLAELQRTLRKADRELRKRVDTRLLKEAEVVVTEARSIITRKGLIESGDLLRKVKPFVRIGVVGVASTSAHGGYPYPKRLEYENRTPGGYGPRASLNPAVDHKEKDIVASMDGVLDGLYGSLA